MGRSCLPPLWVEIVGGRLREPRPLLPGRARPGLLDPRHRQLSGLGQPGEPSEGAHVFV